MRKLLVWDGDDTLWLGALLDGGQPQLPDGRRELCEQLHDRGVLQAVASFNRQADVDALLYRFGLDAWFMHSQASLGGQKSELVTGVTRGYGLARNDDVVFLDDDPMNRAEVESALPGVVSASPADLDRVVVEYFTKETYTEEDRLRVRRYRSEADRAAAAKAHGADHQAFLRSCEITVEIWRATERDAPRISDLAARANRMAAMARVYSDEELNAHIEAGVVYAVSVSDRFGSYGLSAFAIADASRIDAIVVSCRLQGRGVGSALLGWIINHVAEKGERLTAEWTETDYNAGMRNLYDWYRFDIRTDGDRAIAHRTVIEPVTLPDWLTVARR